MSAVVLVALLRGDRIPGLDGPVTRVGLQQRFAGHILDDVVAHTLLPSGAMQTVEYQVKRTCRPVKSDTHFGDVVKQCIAALRADPEGVVSGRRRLGLAALRPASQLATLATLTEIARAHATPGSFHALLGTGAVSRAVRDRHKYLGAVVRSILIADGPGSAGLVDNMTWQVAQALHVWHVEVNEGRDERDAINRLADLLPGGRDAAAIAFSQIAQAVEKWGPRGGVIDEPMLRAELEQRGVTLTAGSSHQAAFASLQEATSQLLELTVTTLGHRLHLPRATLHERLADAVRRHELVLVTGRAGAGKSVLAHLVAQRLRAEGALVVAIPLTGRSGGVADIEAELGTPLAPAFRGAPTGVLRVLVVDGAEQALTDAGRLLMSLLAKVPMDPALAPPWHLVLTARDEAAGAIDELVSRTLGGRRPQTLPVGDLTDQEVTEVLTTFPRLRPLDRHERPRALLLRRPYLIDLLLRASETLDLPSQLLGEEDVVDLVYDRLVRRASGALLGRGSPEARSDVYLAMAEAAFGNELPARLDGSDAEARAGLVSDDLLVRVRASYRFAHDILADYAATTRLLEATGESLVATAVAPRRLIRALRLWMQRRLADALGMDFAGAWTQIVAIAASLAERDGPRWQDVPYEAVLHLGAARQALDAFTLTLLDSKAASLQNLVDVTERLARQRELLAGAPGLPLDLALSGPVVDLLAVLGDRVPKHIRHQAARLIRGHLATAAESAHDPDRGLSRAALLPSALLTWSNDAQRGEQLLQLTIEVLALLGRHLTPEAESFLLRHARSWPDRLSFAVEAHLGARELAKRRPDLLLLLAGYYYLGRGITPNGEHPNPGRKPPSRWLRVDSHEDGVRSHSPRLGVDDLAGPSRGPFAALLATDAVCGLRLVGEVVDAATHARISVEAQLGHPALAVALQLPDWPGERRFRGTAHVWQWYRRLGVGDYPAMSALMALRNWAVARVSSGETLSSVIAQVLGCGESLALIAVAISVLTDAIDRVDNELDSFLEHPLFWHLEHARIVQERSGLAHQLPDAPRLMWTLSEVAMSLVLNGNGERREHLRGVGQRLVERAPELVPESEGASGKDESVRQADLLVRRWAAELDIEHYRVEKHEQGLAVSVEYPDDVRQGLEEGGGRQAQLWLELYDLTFRAVKARDGEPDAEDPHELSRLLDDLQRRTAAEPSRRTTRSEETDAVAAVAAAMVLAAFHGVGRDEEDIPHALTVLRGVADTVRRDVEASEQEDALVIRQTAWSQGADRSAAMAVPLLLVDRELREFAGLSMHDVAGLVNGLATSPFSEVRTRLVTALEVVWSEPCQGAVPSAHDAAIEAVRTLVATAGLGSWTAAGRRSRGYLAEPLESVLATSELIMEVGAASDALPGLISASRLACAHGERARRLLNALVEYDLMVWPAHLARHHYEVGGWRTTLDQFAAGRILEGEHHLLSNYLSAFAPVAEDLHGLLAELAAEATTPQRATVLHDIWPRILDALLPEARSLDSGDGEARRPSRRDVEALDEVLLLMPPEKVEWPWDRTTRLMSRWVRAYRARPHVADRLIQVLGRCGSLANPYGTEVVLLVLGDRVHDIQQSSRLVVAWLRLVLQQRPSAAGQNAPVVGRLLDRLAAAGHEAAIHLQRALEA